MHPPASLADLDNGLRICADQTLEVWYAPMGARPLTPKLWILGITPGWNQMRIAYECAAHALSSGHGLAAAASMPKPQVAFAGSMRSNLVSMLDELGLPEIFGIDSSAGLFGTLDLRTGSVLKYPVFRRGVNYTGHAPKATAHPILLNMLDTVLAAELEAVAPCLILPLGKAVESTLEYSAAKGRLDMSRVLRGFPHPSGANGHRRKQFDSVKDQLRVAMTDGYASRV